MAGDNTELKFFDLDQGLFSNLPAGIILTSIHSGIDQGVGESERTGRKYTIHHVSITYDIQLPRVVAPSLAPDNGDSVRVIMYLDQQHNDGAPFPTTVTSILATADPHSYYNLHNIDRYVILMDRTHNINYLTLTGSALGKFSHSLVMETFKFDLDVRIPVEVAFSFDLLSNNIGLLIITRNTTGQFRSQTRVRFTG